MTNKLLLFKADLLAKKNVGTDQQISDLKNQINQSLTFSNQKYNNDLCFRIPNFILPEWLKLEIDLMIEEFLESYKDDKIFSRHDAEKYDIYSWINVNLPNSRNTMHSHVKAHLSCVYYIQGTDTGNLRLINPANILGNCNPTAPWIRDVEFSPSDGDLIMWPAWVPHEVETNFSSKERINLTSDIILKSNG